MRSWMTVLLAVIITAASAAAAAQLSPEEQRSLRTRLEERYDIVPLTDGVAFRPKTRIPDVRLIEISDVAVSVNGAAVTGRELREKLGADAELILRVSYLSADERRAFVAAGTEAVENFQPEHVIPAPPRFRRERFSRGNAEPERGEVARRRRCGPGRRQVAWGAAPCVPSTEHRIGRRIVPTPCSAPATSRME